MKEKIKNNWVWILISSVVLFFVWRFKIEYFFTLGLPGVILTWILTLLWKFQEDKKIKESLIEEIVENFSFINENVWWVNLSGQSQIPLIFLDDKVYNSLFNNNKIIIFNREQRQQLTYFYRCCRIINNGFREGNERLKFNLNAARMHAEHILKMFGREKIYESIELKSHNSEHNLPEKYRLPKGSHTKNNSTFIKKINFWNALAVLVSVSALGVATYTAMLTKRAVELAADPVISVTLDRNRTVKDASEVMIASGFLPTENSILNLVIRNNSLSTINDVDIRMTLWQVYVNDNHELTICPLGYVSHDDNPNFIISNNLSIDNVFNKTFSLTKGERYPIIIDFGNLKNIKLDPQDSKILLRININYIKAINETNYNYTKLYSLSGYFHVGGDPNKQDIVDVAVAPDFVLGLVDKENSKEVSGFNIPSFIYPFREKELIEYFEKSINKLDLVPSACEEFSFKKTEKIITY
jgi:hypothetical protein